MAIKHKKRKNQAQSNGRLKPCPVSPNCVNSMYSEDQSHYLKPWRYTGSREEAQRQLLATLEAFKNTRLVLVEEGYLHVTFKIPVVGFIDDIEFYLPANDNLIHYRSASRIGRWDMGVNKRRVRRLRKKLASRLRLTT